MNKLTRACAAFGLLLFSSCSGNDANIQHAQAERKKDSLFARDGEMLLKEIDSMTAADQAIRRFMDYGITDERSLDSIEKSFVDRGLRADSGMLMMGQATQRDPKHRDRTDSAMLVMTELETKHTKRMVEILSVYGYPNSKRLGKPERGGVDPFILLHHPDEEYKDTLLTLLDNELRMNRIDSQTREIIAWDLEGRRGIPKGIDLSNITVIDGRTGKAINAAKPK
jgi:hypothetical protein